MTGQMATRLTLRTFKHKKRKVSKQVKKRHRSHLKNKQQNKSKTTPPKKKYKTNKPTNKQKHPQKTIKQTKNTTTSWWGTWIILRRYTLVLLFIMIRKINVFLKVSLTIPYSSYSCTWFIKITRQKTKPWYYLLQLNVFGNRNRCFKFVFSQQLLIMVILFNVILKKTRKVAVTASRDFDFCFILVRMSIIFFQCLPRQESKNIKHVKDILIRPGSINHYELGS